MKTTQDLHARAVLAKQACCFWLGATCLAAAQSESTESDLLVSLIWQPFLVNQSKG